MKSAYIYLFYRVLCFARKTKASEVPEWSAAGFVTLLVWGNLISIYCAMELYVIKDVRKFNIFNGVLFTLLLMIINYFIFLKDDKYLLIEKKYLNEEQSKKTKSIVLTIIYVILTFSIAVFMLTKGREINMMNR